MNQIFISYSRQDADFVHRLGASLGRSYDVWTDREDLQPGVRWESYIEHAISTCAIFVVVVSPRSNESDWVARETLLAERLGTYRVPVLIAGELPFRLLNVHYVDFRGEYEGGLRDLLDIITARLDPHERSSGESTRLLGRAVAALLDGDHANADSLIAQALSLSADRKDWSVEQFWAALRSRPVAPLAATMRDAVRVLERSTKLERGPYHGDDSHEWSIELSGPDEVIASVSHVEYVLHPTFTPLSQVVRDRASHFRITRVGWGRFRVGIDVRFTDGSLARGSYGLTFAPTNDAALPLVPESADP